MYHLLVLCALAGPAPTPPPTPTTVVPFRSEAQPRIDPVFGDAPAFRATVDRFLALQGEMDRVREEFSTSVHETLAALKAMGATSAARECPAASASPYARALASGARYLTLGQQLQTTYRDIRRSDDFGDTVGLTPDYRWKVKKAKDLYQQLLTDYREMRVAFYDQLGTEMRHARCKLGRPAPAVIKPGDPPRELPNPADPGAWVLDEPPVDAEADPLAAGRAGGRPPVAPIKSPGDEVKPASPVPESASSAAQAIWIDIDNTLCPQPTRLTIDGQPLGEIAARKKTSVRTRAGPRAVCVLPTTDSRNCGDSGTIRRAYLHEGWSLTVHCSR